MLLPFWSQVVAEASAEAEKPAVKATSRASLGLKLDHTEVLRWAPMSMHCLLHRVRVLDECSLKAVRAVTSQGCLWTKERAVRCCQALVDMRCGCISPSV